MFGQKLEYKIVYTIRANLWKSHRKRLEDQKYYLVGTHIKCMYVLKDIKMTVPANFLQVWDDFR